MKSGGFGHNPGCGITAEALAFQRRNAAVKIFFETYKCHPETPLARESFTQIGHLFPEKTTLEQYLLPQTGETNTLRSFHLDTYTEWLSVVETTDEWQEVNEAARRGFVTSPEFLKDEKVLQAKLKSSSERVRNYAK